MLFNATRISLSPSVSSTKTETNTSSLTVYSRTSTSIVEPSTSQLTVSTLISDSTTTSLGITTSSETESATSGSYEQSLTQVSTTISGSSSSESTYSATATLATTSTAATSSATTSWLYASTFPEPTSVSLSSDETVIFYTQDFVFTASTTTLSIGLPSMVFMSNEELSTYSAPTAVITTDISYYQRWLDGSLDSQSSSSSSGKRNTIIGSVVGSVGGFLLCALLLWLLVFKRRKNHQKGGQGFSHEIGCRLDHPSDPPEANATVRSVDDETFLKGKYKSLGNRLPLVRRGQPCASDEDEHQHGGEEEEVKANPFQDEFNFQKRLPAPPPVPTRNPPLEAFYTYSSDTSSSTTESVDDSFSIQLNTASGERRSQSFLKEII